MNTKNSKNKINPSQNNFCSIEDYLKLDYYQKIAPYVRDKAVLDVGCVEHSLSRINKRRLWNHWFIYKMAKKVVGIDLSKKSIKTMNESGYNAIVMDAEKINFKQKFDIVFAGELIEHLANPGLFLKSAQKVLKPNGLIVLSTPNTYAVSRIFRVLQGMTNEPPVNTDHTMYFTPLNLGTLAKKSGLKLIKIDYAFFPFAKKSLLSKLDEIFCKILGNKFKEQIIAVFR